MPRIAGVVLLYHPDDGFTGRIQSYIHHVEKLFVIDNSEKPLSHDISSEKLVYVSDGHNGGIAARLNHAAELALQQGFDWLLTMDQDSAFEPDAIESYIRCFNGYVNRDEVAAFGVQFHQPSEDASRCTAVKTLQLITSGSLINLQLYKTIGKFDEALFIDQVDFDYSFRAALKGYESIQFQNIFLQHSLGTESEHFSWKTFRKTKRSLHSPIRIYYMTRNFLYMRSKYRDHFPAEIAHSRKDLIYRLKNGLLYNPKRFSVLSHFFSGLMDYKRSRMGKK